MPAEPCYTTVGTQVVIDTSY